MADVRSQDDVEAQKGAVQAFRAKFLEMPFLPLAKLKKMLGSDHGFKGPVWLSRARIQSPPEPDLRDLLWQSVVDLNIDDAILQKPDYAPADTLWGEWMAVRKDGEAIKHAPVQSQSQEQASSFFQSLSKEAESATTTLFWHGGTFVFGNPASSRSILSQINRDTKGRSFSASYRLSPEHLFPSYLLDALVTYLSLAYPPPGSLHEPVAFKDLILSGESAGASICVALVKVILSIRQGFESQGKQPLVPFHGKNVRLELPAGLALHSIAAEWLMMLPSCNTFFYPDYISGSPPYHAPDYPSDHLWPAKPPRAEIHADGSALLHPLIAPCTIQDFAGFPPMFIAIGEERLRDANFVLAQQAARQGVHVQLLMYQYMPHNFTLVLPRLPQSAHCAREWARAIKDFARGANRNSSATAFHLGRLEEASLDVENLISLDAEQARKFSIPGLIKAKAFLHQGPLLKTKRTTTGSAKI